VNDSTVLSPPNISAANDAEPRQFDRRRLVNRINYLSFQNRTVLLNFEHASYGDTVRVAARPQPCEDSQLRCAWVEPPAARALSRYYVFASLCVPDEQRLLQGTGNVISMDKDGITIELAASCTEVDARRVVRHACRDVQVQVLSSGSRFDGTLVDFSSLSFRVRIGASPPQTFGWLNATALELTQFGGHPAQGNGRRKVTTCQRKMGDGLDAYTHANSRQTR